MSKIAFRRRGPHSSRQIATWRELERRSRDKAYAASSVSVRRLFFRRLNSPSTSEVLGEEVVVSSVVVAMVLLLGLSPF